MKYNVYWQNIAIQSNVTGNIHKTDDLDVKNNLNYN